MKKVIIAIICVLSLIVVVSPVVENWKEEPKDDFPLSYYPMFTGMRGESAFVHHLYGIDENNNYYPIPHKVIAQRSGFNSFRKTVTKIIKNGQAKKLCSLVSNKLSNLEVEPYNQIKVVKVVTSVINIEEFMNKRFESKKKFFVYAECRVR